MPLDGSVVAAITYELNNQILGGRIDKIIQPEPTEIILSIRCQGVNHKLLMTANANTARVCLTQQSKQAPLTAPMFCMVLRKHIANGRIVRITQIDFDRILRIDIEALDEMGDKSVKHLVIEMMGKHSNIMLLNANTRVVDAIKHIPPSVSAVRPILPSTPYEQPPSQNKIAPIQTGNVIPYELFQNQIMHSVDDAYKKLYGNFTGISPAFAKIITQSLPPDAEDKQLYEAFCVFMKPIIEQHFMPAIHINDSAHHKKSTDFSVYLLKPSLNATLFTSVSEMLETYYARKDNAERVAQKTQEMRRHIQMLLDRAKKKAKVFDQSIIDVEAREALKIKGELITAYLYSIEKGIHEFYAENYYQNNELIKIKLDPDLSPSENAQKYYKQYNKQKRAYHALQEQIEKNNQDIAYLESVLVSMENASGEDDIIQIRDELIEQGYVKARNHKKNKKNIKAKPHHYTSVDGFDIYVGKNNTQNDELTFKLAKPTDLWLHTKDIPGSHVIVFTQGKELPEATILEAAELAAYYSKAKNGSNVPVDYVQRRHVKKPNSAKPGFVIYDYHQTVYVTPTTLNE